MTVTFRTAQSFVYIDGNVLPYVLSSRVTRALDQELSTAEVVVPWPMPNYVRMWSLVSVHQGIDPSVLVNQRFVGYVIGFTTGLWPGTITIQCADPLVLAKYFYPNERISLANMTDQRIIMTILNTCGIAVAFDLVEGDQIHGTGKIVSPLVTDSSYWPFFESGLEVIKEVDSVSTGYRTFSDAGGGVRRDFIPVLPSASAAYEFNEGVDVLEGSSTFEILDPKNEIQVIGDGVLSTISDDDLLNPLAFRRNPYWTKYTRLQQELQDVNNLSTEEVAIYLLSRLNRNLMRVSFTTFRDERLEFPMTIQFASDKLLVDALWHLQSVTTEVTPEGGFSQQIGLISELSLNQYVGPGNVTAQNPLTGGIPITTPVSPTLPAGTVNAMFSIPVIDKNPVVIGGVETFVYVMTAIAGSTATGSTIASHAWTATGPGVFPASGSGPMFTVRFTDLATASISLTSTDALGHVATANKSLAGGGGIPIRSRTFYLAAGSALEMWDGSAWTRYVLPSGTCEVVANGPAWGVLDKVYFLPAGVLNLNTVPSSSTPIPGVNITALWIEPDINILKVAAGFSDGRIAISSDAGATWTVRNGPDSNSVVKLILSRFTPGQLQLINSAGYWISDNEGSSWRAVINAGDYRDLDLGPSWNLAAEFIASVGQMIQAEPGTVFTGAAAENIRTVTQHIRLKRGYCIADDGTAYYVATDGATALTAGAQLIAGSTPQGAGSLYRDGAIPDEVYAAVLGQVIKTTDGFKTAEGQLIIRVAGVGTADAGAQYKQLGAGLMSSPSLSPTGLLAVSDNKLWIRTQSGIWSSKTTTNIGLSGTLYWVASPPGLPNVWTVMTNLFEIRQTVDSGQTWNTIPGPGGGLTGEVRFGHGATANDLYIGTTIDGIYRTTNGGSSWTQIVNNFIVSPSVPSPIFALHVGASRLTFTSYKQVSGITEQVVHYCNLDGTGLTTLALTLNQSIKPTPMVDAVGDADDTYFYLTDNDGATPTSRVYKLVGGVLTAIDPTGVIYAASLYPVHVLGNGSVVLVVMFENGQASLRRSADNGTTWTTPIALGATDVLIDEDEAGHFLMANDPLNSGRWWVMSNTIGKLKVSTDGGVTWSDETVAGLNAAGTFRQLLAVG